MRIVTDSPIDEDKFRAALHKAISNAITIQSTVNHDIKQLKKRLDPFRELKIEMV